MKTHCSQALNELLGVWSSSCWMETWASAWKWKVSLSIIIRASVSVSISSRPQGSSRILSGPEQWPGPSLPPAPPPAHNVPRIYTRYLHFFCNSKSKSERGFSEHFTCTTEWGTRISCHQYQGASRHSRSFRYIYIYYLFLLTTGGMVVVCVLTVLFCHAIISFTFGMSNLVFWILTCCQCPFPCQQYKGVYI